MRSLQTEAIVLRVADFGESDRIVRLLAPEAGRLTAIAKGAKRSRRRFPGTLDLFNRLFVQIDRRRTAAMARLEHARLLDPFERLRARPRCFALACFLVELIDRLAPEGGARADARRLYRFTSEALGLLAECEPDARLRLLLELRAFDALGLRPELRRCVRCGGTTDAGPAVNFAIAEGGPVCPRCARTNETWIALHPGTLRALDVGLRLPPERLGLLRLGPVALGEARALVGRFQRFHVGVELRSERFLDHVLGASRPAPRAPAANAATSCRNEGIVSAGSGPTA